MKKIYVFAMVILFAVLANIPFSSKAQVDTSTVQKLLQYIMQPLDKNQISLSISIPSGYLMAGNGMLQFFQNSKFLLQEFVCQ